MRNRLGIGLIALMFLMAMTVFAQTNTGIISGRVTDPSGAVVAGAAITITETETNVESVSQTNSDGLFPVTGSITIAGASCTSTFSFTGLAAGPNISATLASTSGPTATGVVTGTINAGIYAPSLTLSINILSSGCNDGAFNATFSQ